MNYTKIILNCLKAINYQLERYIDRLEKNQSGTPAPLPRTPVFRKQHSAVSRPQSVPLRESETITTSTDSVGSYAIKSGEYRVSEETPSDTRPEKNKNRPSKINFTEFLHTIAVNHKKSTIYITGGIAGFCIFIIVALFLYIRMPAPSATPSNGGDGALTTVSVEENNTNSNSEDETTTPTSTTSAVTTPVATISFDDVRRLFEAVKPDFSTPVDTVTYGQNSFILYYSIDSTLYKLGEKYLRQYAPKYGAICVIEPKTGRILSLNSYTRENEPAIGDNLYCSAIFPAASIFKTITAACAVDFLGLRSTTMLETSGARHTLYQRQLTEELNYSTEVSLEEAFAYSINSAFGRIGIYMTGAKNLNHYALKFGFTKPIPFELSNGKATIVVPDSSFELAEVASGFNRTTSISPLFGSLIASSIANRGIMPSPTIVDSIKLLTTGQTIYTRRNRIWRTPIDSSSAEEMVAMMKSVVEYGTGRKSFKTFKQSTCYQEVDVGGKTGNIQKDSLGRVDWFIGFSRHKSDTSRNIAVGIVTVHDAYWTVHSSYLGAELMLKNTRSYLKEKKQMAEEIAADTLKVSFHEDSTDTLSEDENQ